jgi:alpha-glucosidase (family GH31 glycosyl hydrolase)
METYRKFASIHTDLAPYLLNAGTVCYAQNISVIKPLARKVNFGVPTNFDYLLHDDLFVSPFTDNSTIKLIKFPGKNVWTYWFNSSQSFYGGQETNLSCPFTEFPVFLKAGSIIPLHVQNSYSNMGSIHSKDFITLLITKPLNGLHNKEIHEFQSSGYLVKYEFNETISSMEVQISAHQKNRFILLLNGVQTSPIVASVRSNHLSDVFQTIQEKVDDFSFWSSTENALLKIEKSKQVYIKVTDSATRGLHLILNNFRNI